MRTAAHPGVALRAEWTKLCTVAGPAGLLAALVIVTVVLSAAVAAATTCPTPSCDIDPVKVSLTGVQIGQAVVAVLAVLSIGGEYSTGMIRTTLVAMPGRGTVLAAKAVTLTGPVLIGGAVAVLGSLLAGRASLDFSLTAGPTLRAAGGTVLYLVLIALLSLGAAAVIREPAVSIGVVLGLLYLFPIVAAIVSDPVWQRRLERIGPSNAGLAVQNTVHLDGSPIGPWSGLGVLAVWAAGALVAGLLTLRVRDA